MVERITGPLRRILPKRIIQPVIIEIVPGRLWDLIEELRPYSFEPVRGLLDRLSPAEIPYFFPRFLEIPRFRMLSAVLPREVIEDYAEDSRVVRIYPDRFIFALGYSSSYPTVPSDGVFVAERRIREKKRITFTSTFWTKKLIGADKANAKGYVGKGVRVAVLDTGSSALHEALRGKIEYPTGSAFPFPTFDANGHGSWCAACIGGRRVVDDILSRLSGKTVVCEGVAPEATIIPIKCLDYVVGMGSDSSIIKSIEYALASGAEILSMSLGGDSKEKSEEEDPYYNVFREIKTENVIPVVAAGNEGPGENTIGTPGCITDVLTVGAYDPITGEIASYSSRGPTNWGSVKPDCVAPGGGYPENAIDGPIVNLLDMTGDSIENRFSPIQGTSMATPAVAGLVALMLQLYRTIGRTLTLDEIKRMLSELGHPKTNDDGWGLISWDMIESWVETEYGIRI